ncbi:MAG: hypothetical protein EOO88_34095 [Pedobacter sp.]|nr:MAG: hypothetical protein EOO88_34095 [Pedobacter sp.]
MSIENRHQAQVSRNLNPGALPPTVKRVNESLHDKTSLEEVAADRGLTPVVGYTDKDGNFVLDPTQYDPGTANYTELPAKKRRFGAKAFGAVLAGSVALGIGYNAIPTDDSEPGTSSAVPAGEAPAQIELQDQGPFPDSVLFSQSFNTLAAEQQAVIKDISSKVRGNYEAGIATYEASNLSEQELLLYGDWVLENNTAVTKDYADVLATRDGDANLNPTVEPGPSNSAQEIHDIYAEKYAVGTNLVDMNQSGSLVGNPDVASAYASFVFEPGTDIYKNYLDNYGDKGGAMSVLTADVYESQEWSRSGTQGILYAGEFSNEQTAGRQYFIDTAVWVPYTDIHGNDTGTWRITKGTSYSAPQSIN